MLAHFSHHVATGVLVPLLPLIREGFGLNYFQSGILISSFSISYGFGQVPMAFFSDRLGHLLTITIGLMGLSLTGVVLSFTNAFWQMVSCFIAMGLFGATYHAPSSSFISQVLPMERRGRGMGLHVLGGNASFFLTPLMAVGVATLFRSWRASFFVLAMPSFLVSLLFWLNIRRSPDGIERKGQSPSIFTGDSLQKQTHENLSIKPEVSWLEMIRSIGFLVILSITMQIVNASINSYLPLYMVDHHHISPKWAGLVTGVIWGMGMVGAPMGGGISDVVGRKRVILFSIALSGPLFLAFASTSFGILLFLFLALYGLVVSVRMPIVESHIADVIPVGRRTAVFGIYFLISQETTTITTPFIGYLIDLYGSSPVFISLGLWLCLSASFAWFFKRHI
jgi:FSR family fosmidomycin resistance protein-like MFS transporter